jgi:hypothetical protein
LGPSGIKLSEPYKDIRAKDKKQIINILTYKLDFIELLIVDIIRSPQYKKISLYCFSVSPNRERKHDDPEKGKGN